MPTMLPQEMLLKFMGLSGRNMAVTYPPKSHSTRIGCGARESSIMAGACEDGRAEAGVNGAQTQAKRASAGHKRKGQWSGSQLGNSGTCL